MFLKRLSEIFFEEPCSFAALFTSELDIDFLSPRFVLLSASSKSSLSSSPSSKLPTGCIESFEGNSLSSLLSSELSMLDDLEDNGFCYMTTK